MRKFFLTVAVLFALFSLSAQEDLYQQYMNQYKNNTPAQPAQQPAAEPAKPAEEKKEEAAPAEEKKEEEKKEEAPAETGEEAAAAAADEEENDKMTPAAVKPYFEVTVFGGGSTGITTFGGDIAPHNSYRMGIDNAVVDLKGGNRMFNGRLLFDLAKGFKTTKEWEINYDYDKELEGSRIETAADGLHAIFVPVKSAPPVVVTMFKTSPLAISTVIGVPFAVPGILPLAAISAVGVISSSTGMS